MKSGLGRIEVRAIFRRNFVGRWEEEPSLIDCIADAVGELVEENNEKLCEKLQEVLKKPQ